MVNKLKKGLLGSLVFFIGGLWLSISMAMPLFTVESNLEIVRFSWLGLPIIGAFAFTGLFGAVVVALVLSLMQGKQIMRSAKFVLIPAMLMGFLGAGVNYANYHFVIKPMGLVACPKMAGYGKNLLIDYVKNIDSCQPD
ncbi:hypothetical protein [Vibrio cholerae]|uniref:hypothetical protein n=1 Tax=Vibrio cholerae TaxID=666 RepID=UPI0001D5AA66|nr:hypothetical protein [Vibrio cholerae]EFH72318.1 predicted protein [Vibrio cholerae RC385]OFI75758.1 hypothetical protein BFX15_18150 [Vibrio cholerae]OFI78342.1 hypothetical protein BFX16_19105 [Vibrio cholerae]